MSSWHSYPKVWSIGHGAAAELFHDAVIIEEKVDGSQFSFGVIDGVLRIKSKGQELIVDAPEKMFSKAVATVFMLQHHLTPGWTYRCEYLQKPKHNVLAYDRTPTDYLILFDVNTGEESYLSRADKEKEAERLGLEVVPLLYVGKVQGVEELKALLDRTSILGGQKIEGFVVKNYAKFGPDKKALIAKYVSEAFKEIHGKTWKTENPGVGDIIQQLIGKYKTSARWDKAIIHLKEAGTIEGSPRDIGKLVNEVKKDAELECSAEIAQDLLNWALPQILRAMTGGLPEYYKQKLLENAFENKDVA